MTTPAQAYKYRDLGFSFYPLQPKTKLPLAGQPWGQWQERLPNDKEIDYFFAEEFNRGIAIITGQISGNLVCLDFDEPETYQKWIDKYPIGKQTATQKTGSGNYHVLFYIEELPNFTDGLFEDLEVEVKANGHSFTVWPSIHPSGNEYNWMIAPWDSLLTLRQIDEVGIMKPIVEHVDIVLADSDSKYPPYIEAVLRGELGRLASKSNGSHTRNNQLFKSACGIYGFVKTGHLLKSDADSQIMSVAGQIGLLTGDETKKTHATLESAWEKAVPKVIPNNNNFIPASGKANLEFVLSCSKRGEKGDAELFAKTFEGKVAYDPDEKEWYRWTGHYWVKDDAEFLLHDFSNGVGAEYLEALGKLKRLDKPDEDQKYLKDKIGSLNSHVKVDGSLKWSKSLLRNKDWNENLDLLPFENGTLDLRTGELKDSNPADYLRTPVPRYWKGLDEPAPKFEKFLLETQGGDQEMAEYLKRLLYVGLLGRSNEAIFPIFWGPGGRNGKSTLMRLMRDIFGPKIADIVEKEVVFKTIKFGGGPSPELYKLRGLRIAFTIETEEGETLSPAKVKHAMGHDPIPCRNLHMNTVTFDPTHTIFLLTNPKPKIPEDAGDDEAFWYRVKLIGWTQKFIDEPILENEHVANKDLDVELLEEAPGIIASIIRSGLRYLTEGLNTPDKVKETTQEYRQESDVMTRWKDDCCVIGPEYKTELGRLWENYKDWFLNHETGEAKEKIPFGKSMSKQFEKKQLTVNGKTDRYWIGIAVKKDLPEPRPIAKDLFKEDEEKEPDF